jgi:SH3 domain protein
MDKPNKVVGVVHTGDPVRVLEEQDNFVKIENTDKKIGWIGKQYITKVKPGSLNEQQLKQEVADLRKQLEAKAVNESSGADKAKVSTESCAAIQQKLNDAEKQVLLLQEQQKKQAASLAASGKAQLDPEEGAQLEETSLRYNQLVVEYEKRGKEIADLQNALAKKDDTTRFLWFGAGAAVFSLGLLAGRSAHRKKNKFLY